MGDRFCPDCPVGTRLQAVKGNCGLARERLAQMGYSTVRVINAGLGGCGTFCQLGQLENNIDWMQPDLVVDSVFVGNNISENVLWTASGYQAAPWHPKGITWGPKASQLVDESGHWFPRNGLAPADIPPPWDASQPLPEPVVRTTTPSTAPIVPRPDSPNEPYRCAKRVKTNSRNGGRRTRKTAASVQ